MLNYPLIVNIIFQTEDSKITRDQLASNLARCLTCVDDFADYCIPLGIQKLEASLEVAKLDSLYLLVNKYNIFINKFSGILFYIFFIIPSFLLKIFMMYRINCIITVILVIIH